MFKKWIYKLITLFLLATSFPIYAQLVTIDFTATVDLVDDMENVLNGEVTVGQTITGSYTYDTSLTDNDSTPEHGHFQYPDIVPSNVGINAQIGNLTFDRSYATNSTNYILHVANTTYFDSFDATMNGNGQSIGLLSNHEAYVDDISVGFGTPNTNAINSDTLDEATANLANFTDNRFNIFGRGVLSNGMYSISATIASFNSSTESTPATPLHISPASGPLVIGQYFDAGIVIDSGYSSIEFIEATLDNVYGANYVDCVAGPLSTDGRQTILCRNISYMLIPGTNALTVNINFVDGQTLNSTVNWDVVGN